MSDQCRLRAAINPKKVLEQREFAVPKAISTVTLPIARQGWRGGCAARLEDDNVTCGAAGGGYYHCGTTRRGGEERSGATRRHVRNTGSLRAGTTWES